MQKASNPNEGTWTKEICGVCPASCWVGVRIEDNRLSDIRTDLDYPLGALVDAVLKGQPYPVRALIIHGASLLTSWL